MSHVDEGLLHAILDGELEFAAEGRAVEIEAHLAACAECRARLEDVRRVHGRAAGILEAVAPVKRTPPPFEELVLRANRDRGSSPAAGDQAAEPVAAERETGHGRWYLPAPPALAWAASIALALGAGWFGREALRPVGGPAAEFAARSTPASGPVDTRSGMVSRGETPVAPGAAATDKALVVPVPSTVTVATPTEVRPQAAEPGSGASLAANTAPGGVGADAAFEPSVIGTAGIAEAVGTVADARTAEMSVQPIVPGPATAAPPAVAIASAPPTRPSTPSSPSPTAASAEAPARTAEPAPSPAGVTIRREGAAEVNRLSVGPQTVISGRSTGPAGALFESSVLNTGAGTDDPPQPRRPVLEGVVVTGRTSTPLAGVRLTLLATDGGVVATAVSDLTGGFGFVDVPPGEYRLRAERDGLTLASEFLRVPVVSPPPVTVRIRP